MNVSNTKSKNLVLASPLKQNLNKNRNWLGAPGLLMAPLTRGGAEDMHKARGQGHKKNLRPRPSTVLPRTDPLEAKDRNGRGQAEYQGHIAQVIFKKKSSLQNQKIVLSSS